MPLLTQPYFGSFERSHLVMMYGKTQHINADLVSQQSPLLISPQLLPDSTVRTWQKDHSQQVMKENQLAHHIDSRVVDSAFHFLKASGLTR
jgi:hypothetical protein